MNRIAVAMAAMAVIAMPAISRAELPSDAACAKVKIEIMQELTIERIAFDAKMVITNNMPEREISGIDVDVIIRDTSGSDAGSAFFTAQPTYRNITGVDGTGVVGSMQSAEVHWLIIPSPGAGGSDPLGKKYLVGATLRYTIEGVEETVNVSPDVITVKPEAQLVLDYFIPYKVVADNPFTPEVEPPVPFPLAVRVLNDGFGAARALKIESAQPKITENNQGLLVDFMLLGASVNDSPVEPTLALNVGDVGSKTAAMAAWRMQSSLSGKFTEFDVKFTHDAGLGGMLTSLIRNTTANYYVHSVKVNLPGRDGRLDILADSDRDAEHLPDTIFESEIPGEIKDVEHSKSPVTVLDILAVDGRPSSGSPEVAMQAAQGPAGWVYARVEDPADGLLRLLGVRRADGVLLDPNNYWTSSELDDEFETLNLVHILDYRKATTDPSQYYLVYEEPTVDETPPVSGLRLNGASLKFSDGSIYVAPSTSIVVFAEDNPGGSGVAGMYRKLSGADPDFVPALPFVIYTAGGYELEYYSEDRAGNLEASNSVLITVDDAAPSISNFIVSPTEFSPSAMSGVDAARRVYFDMMAMDEVIALYGKIEIFGAQSSAPVAVMEFPLASGASKSLAWDGRDMSGSVVASGTYTARLSVWDGLGAGHMAASLAEVQVADWFVASPLAASQYPQMNPSVWAREIVWQDKRSGGWDIYYSQAGGQEVRITSSVASEEMPSISGNLIVWQDNRSGNWDVYGLDRRGAGEFVVYSGAGNQRQPVVDGDWVTWQDDRSGNWDIYLHNVHTGETRQVTNHERDQINPRLSGDTLVWEDYRHGLAEIYAYSISGSSERRVTYDIQTQVQPAADGGVILWSDSKAGGREIYYEGGDAAASRLTYNGVNSSRPILYNGVVVYEKESGGNPDIAFVSLRSGIGASLVTAASRQERPSAGDGLVVWQDNRDGVYQIYWANLEIVSPPITYTLRRGFNLIAVGDKLAAGYPTSDSLMASVSGVEKAVTFDASSGRYLESSSSSDISLRRGTGIGLYVTNTVSVDVAGGDERTQYTLLPGPNYIGILSIPAGYSAYDIIASLGGSNIQSVRRFNNITGAWETVAMEEAPSGPRPAGPDFTIVPGDGLEINMKNRVDGWKP